MERNILLTIEYDGSGFAGWQRQPDVRTVQGEIEAALSRVCGIPVAVNGTSRTDAGVHALGQRASFKGDFGIPVEKIAFAANNILSGGGRLGAVRGDVRILKAEEVPADFHARFDAVGKKYRYIIENTPEVNIFRRKYCYNVDRPLDADAMRRAAAYVTGTRDFASFQSAGGQPRQTTVRTVSSLGIDRRGDDIIIEILDKAISENPTAKGFIFDGFPRTVVQAEALDSMLRKRNMRVDVMLNVDVPANELVKRLLLRGQTSGRSDDNLATVQQRIQTFEEKTLPVMQFYDRQGKHCRIKGDNSVEEVFADICAAIDQAR